jgi:formylglycine-generating enzyme required for sulfatase activity
MALVAGDYCPRVRQDCLAWLEPPSLGGDGRCARFAPSECIATREPSRFCIDRDEYTPPGNLLPMNFASWSDARRVCETAGKRLCRESEWNLACEGEALLPYPTGLLRDNVRCNFDRMDLYDARGRPRDLRLPASMVAACVSPFGVRSLVGNVDEWVQRDVTWGRWRSALKGGWWLAGRNRCRPATTAHDERYRDFQTGFRCCADAPPPERPMLGTPDAGE